MSINSAQEFLATLTREEKVRIYTFYLIARTIDFGIIPGVYTFTDICVKMMDLLILQGFSPTEEEISDCITDIINESLFGSIY